ncbi:hypothetical protein SGLAM104S_03504 [Streptomyces glaucescens]|jgi:hypothetical protein
MSWRVTHSWVVSVKRELCGAELAPVPSRSDASVACPARVADST